MSVCWLMQAWKGLKPTQSTFAMLSYYLTDLASGNELLAHDELLAHCENLKADGEAKTQVLEQA